MHGGNTEARTLKWLMGVVFGWRVTGAVVSAERRWLGVRDIGTRLGARLVAVAFGVLAIVNVGCGEKRGGSQDRLLGSKQQSLAFAYKREFRPSVPEDHAGYWGAAVAMRGHTIAISSSRKVFVYERSGENWEEQQVLTNESASFGDALALTDDALIVGSPYDDSAGVVYVYERRSDRWEQVDVLRNDSAPSFGETLAIDGETLAVGAPDHDSVYTYERLDGAWVEPQKLTPESNGPRYFGGDIAISNDTILVGGGKYHDTPATYVFVREGKTWSVQSRLTGDVHWSDAYGHAVAIDGDVAALASTIFEASETVIAIDVFARENKTWQKRQRLESTIRQGVFRLEMGHEIIIAGAHDGGNRGGLLQLFEGPVGGMRLTHSVANYNLNDQLGRSLALDGRSVLVGAPSAPDFSIPRAYLFALGCLSDAHCKPREYCGSDGNCHSAKAIGTTCDLSAGADCKEPNCGACGSATCVDGVCCDKQCAGPCDACSRSLGAREDGRCSVLPAGSLGTPDCGLLTCNGDSSVCSACFRDTDCPEDKYCAPDGTCQTKKEPGTACDDRESKDCRENWCRVCKGGLCRDGVCCGSPCIGECVACARALTGVADGTCAPILAGTDPYDQCEADWDFPSSCKADGFCNGAGACRSFAPKNTACGETTCSSRAIAGMLCDGEGECVPGEMSCAPYGCAGDVCAVTCSATTECAPGTFCFAGTCTEKRQNGAACEDKGECQSNSCVDGVCCDKPCTGQCEACAELGSAGHCIAITGMPRGARSPCSSAEHPECAGHCNGKDAAACAYPDSTRVCGSECSGDRVVESACDGEGACNVASEKSCGPYACRDNACLLSCTESSDCIEGYSCVASNCVPTGGPKCSEDGASSIGLNGITLCDPYLCDPASGACRQSCGAATDCAANYVCDSDKKNCVSVISPTSIKSEEGCSCQMPGTRGFGFSPPQLLPLLLLLSRRIRRRRSVRAPQVKGAFRLRN